MHSKEACLGRRNAEVDALPELAEETACLSAEELLMPQRWNLPGQPCREMCLKKQQL